uniref:ShKT domain-containing protein n=1 Tax=Rhabditophanes sp. KR3021 TaxID=114890 RepID=A0AC35UFU6_9BILA
MVSCKLVLVVVLCVGFESVFGVGVGEVCSATDTCDAGLACNEKPPTASSGTLICSKACVTGDTTCPVANVCTDSTTIPGQFTCDLSSEAANTCDPACAGTCNEATLQCELTTIGSTDSTTVATTVGTCTDIAPNCEALNAQGLCTDAKYQALMSSDCAATCSFCALAGAGTGAAGGGIGVPSTVGGGTSTTTCVDLVTGGPNSCTALAANCNVAAWYSVMTTNCPRTCQRCLTSNTGTVCADTYKANGTTDCVESKKNLCTNPTYQTMYSNINGLADSDGKDFVFSFTNWNAVQSFSYISVIVMPILKDTTCKLQYHNITMNVDVTSTFRVSQGSIFEFKANAREIMKTSISHITGLDSMDDCRLLLNCQDDVKVVGKYSDVQDGYGDLFLVPSTKNAGKKYVLGLPTTSQSDGNHVVILPIPSKDKDETIKVDVSLYENDVLQKQASAQIGTTFGARQFFVMTDLNYKVNATIVIVSSKPIMVSLVSPNAQNNNYDTNCAQNCHWDYTVVIPLPVIENNCFRTSKIFDDYVITNNFTTRLYVAPPLNNCNFKVLAQVVDDIGSPDGTSLEISALGFTNLTLSTRNQVEMTYHYTGGLRVYRQGGIIQTDGVTAFGTFLAYMPSYNEYVTGATPFYSLNKGCVLELYTKADTDKNGLIVLDGVGLKPFRYTKTQFKINDRKHFLYIIPLVIYGYHYVNLSNDAYTAYVVCKAVNGPFDANGYNIGYNNKAFLPV